jgi:hypothetical protein
MLEEVKAASSSSATVTVRFSASVPLPPLRLSPSIVPAEPEYVSSPDPPVNAAPTSAPVVSDQV